MKKIKFYYVNKMKTLIMVLSLYLSILSVPVQASSPETHQNALIWAKTFQHLIETHQIEQAQEIEQIGVRIFGKDSIWSDENFRRVWMTYQYQKRLDSWEYDIEQKGLWKFSDDKTATLGLLSRQDGLWTGLIKWEKGLSCVKTCFMLVSTSAGQTVKWDIHSVQDNFYEFIVPPSFLPQTPMTWTFKSPSNLNEVTFSVDYFPWIWTQRFQLKKIEK